MFILVLSWFASICIVKFQIFKVKLKEIMGWVWEGAACPEYNEILKYMHFD